MKDITDMPAFAPPAAYDIDPIRGFVPGTDPVQALGGDFAAWDNIAADMSGLIRTRQVRNILSRMPELDPLQLQTTPERERAFLLLTTFASAWAWGGAEPNFRIPRNISVPLWALVRTMGRVPITHYACLALNNWKQLDPAAPLSADNMGLLVKFLGGVDEDWFFLTAVGIELLGAPLLPLMQQIAAGTHQLSDAELEPMVETFAAGIPQLSTMLDRTREWCDPHVFYKRVRLYVTGWPEPGAVYEGVSETPQMYVGGSAAQSSLIQALDAVLGVAHDPKGPGAYLMGVRKYMPPKHLKFLQDVEAVTRLRSRVQSGSEKLRKHYNDAVHNVDMFRRVHMGLAHDYIIKPSGMDLRAKGTGGTALNDFLRTSRDETTRTKV